MERLIPLEDKRVSVIGAGRSGIAAAALLKAVGADVLLSDRNPDLERSKEIVRLKQSGVETELGVHSDSIFHADLMIVSPGVPQNAHLITVARERGVPVASEIEFASWYTDLPIVAVTGSNGKTTTATVLNHMFRQGDYTPFLSGNIGTPFSSIVVQHLHEAPANGIHVLEISSFQMEHIWYFRPHIAVLLNLSPDHLDRYASMAEYVSAKMRIIENMTEDDHIVYNGDDPVLRGHVKPRARLIPFSLHKNPEALFRVNEKKVYDQSEEIVIYLKDISLPGRHNLANFLAAATASRILNVPLRGISEVMKTFRGVPHRLEHVRTIDGIDFFNDSKATNIQSVKTAIDAFSRPIILIMGGRDKGADFRELLPLATEKVKQILVLGETADRIEETLSHVVPCKKVTTVESAVSLAHQNAEKGDAVLLSPGCASFDMFVNFEERGETFKKAVNRLRRKQ